MSDKLLIIELESKLERRDAYILELEKKLNSEDKTLPAFLKEQVLG